MYYDSLSGSGLRYCLLIKYAACKYLHAFDSIGNMHRDYLSRRSILQGKGDIDWKQWNFVSVKVGNIIPLHTNIMSVCMSQNIPQQHNGYDCGAFVLQVAIFN